MASITKNKAFSASELVFLNKLYRSRNFKDNITNPSTNQSFVFVIYGSINAFSAKQRNRFRSYISTITTNGAVTIQLSLMSNFVTQNFISFSAFRSIKNFFHGTIYELKIEIITSDEEQAYTKLNECISQLKDRKFSETIPFNFVPALIILTNSNTVISPLRFNQQLKFISNTPKMHKTAVRQNLIALIELPLNKLILAK
jgi:hypothetical protein